MSRKDLNIVFRGSDVPTIALDRVPVPAAVWTNATGNVAVAPFQAAPGHPFIGTITPSALPLAANGFPTLEVWGVRKGTWWSMDGAAAFGIHAVAVPGQTFDPALSAFFDPMAFGVILIFVIHVPKSSFHNVITQGGV
jgi:hypothetical protein